MSIPSLPTDNLYKFIAVSGLFLLGLGIVVPVYIKKEMADMAARQTIADDKLIGESHERLYKLFNDEFPKEADKEVRRRAFLETAENQREKTREKSKRMLDVQSVPLLESLENLFWLRILGVLVSIAGFVLWFWRVQMLQDKLLREELETARAENAEKRAAGEAGANNA